VIIRVDDFPHGRESDATMGVNPWGMLNNFVAALDHPFLLACLFGPLRREDVDTLEEVSHQITLGAHGQWHTHADANEVVYVQAMRTRLGPDAVFVEPQRHLPHGLGVVAPGQLAPDPELLATEGDRLRPPLGLLLEQRR